MAIGTTHPPRAYTRETLTAAFNWLQTQPDAVRSKATSPDTLVSIYTRAQRFGPSNLELEAPVSSQNFMSDLKNLAEGLKAFDGTAPLLSPTPAPVQHVAAPIAQAPAVKTAVSTVANAAAAAPAAAATATTAAFGLNEKSAQMLQEVQAALNLSSESEAMNMMVAIAYKSLKASVLA